MGYLTETQLNAFAAEFLILLLGSIAVAIAGIILYGKSNDLPQDTGESATLFPIASIACAILVMVIMAACIMLPLPQTDFSFLRSAIRVFGALALIANIGGWILYGRIQTQSAVNTAR